MILAVVLTPGREAAWAQGPTPAPPPAPPEVKGETRAIPDRDVKQVRAQAIIQAPPHVVRAVIADLERYPAFMPYVKDSRILSRDPAGDVLNYQRLSFPIPVISDRHYAIRMRMERAFDADLIAELERLPVEALRDPTHQYSVVEWLPAPGWSHEQEHLGEIKDWWRTQRPRGGEQRTAPRQATRSRRR